MLGIAVIVFREVVEAALVVGIVLAASRGVPRRILWIAGGIAGGVLGAGLVACFTAEISDALEGAGQEVFNAAVLSTAVVMLGWHNIWMRRHGREMAEHASSIGASVRAGARPLYALGIVVAIAVLREGSEIVLFVYGLVAAQGSGPAAVLAGGAIGLVGGVAIGTAIYLGLLAIPLRHLFAVTSFIILLLAAGMASQAASFLLQADLIPAFGGQIWDSSFLLSDQSLLGQLLHVLTGYVARPTGVQLAVYLATIAVIGGLMLRYGRRDPARATA